MNNDKVIFLLDMDAFFASCHIAEDDSLKDLPVVISSPNKRAIIATASYKARDFGIKTGMPLFHAKELCPDVIVVESDFKLYVKYSEAIWSLISQNFSKNIEVASIDECYIDVTKEWKKYGSVKKMAQTIMDKIYSEMNLTCSIGISTNKFLAKSCVDFNKPFGISFLLKEDIKEKLWPLPIRKMHGVGEASEILFKENNINTIGDLAKYEAQKIINIFGKRGYTLYEQSNGRGSDVVNNEDNNLKSIGNELTLDTTTNDTSLIEELILELSKLINKRSTLRCMIGKTISIVLKYEKTNKDEPFNKRNHLKHVTHQVTLPIYTNSWKVIYNNALECFYEYWNGNPLLLIGVRLSNIKPDLNINTQLTIDDIIAQKELEKDIVQKIIYDVNFDFKKNVLFTGEEYIKIKELDKNQSKFLKTDDRHLSNSELIKKWKGD